MIVVGSPLFASNHSGRGYSYAEGHHLADLTSYFAGRAGLIAEPATRALVMPHHPAEPNEPRQSSAPLGIMSRGAWRWWWTRRMRL